MADLGDLIARLLLDGTQWATGMQKAEAEAQEGAAKIEGSLAGISESLGKMGEALAGLAIAEGLKDFAEDAIKASNEIGKFSSAMVALKGNGEDTAAFLEHIHELAATSPFAFPELAASAQKMVQLGASMGQTAETMTAITQMGTALKMTSEQVSGIAGGMAKLASGKDPMKTMNALIAEGVPVWQMLAEQMGTNMTDAQAKVKAGLISNGEVIKALTASMGTYADTASKWGDTWAGAMKGFNDESHKAMAAIGDDIKHALTDIGAPALKAVTEALTDAVTWWKNLSAPVKDAILAFGGAIGVIAGVGAVIATLSLALGAIGAPIALAVLGIAAVVAALVGLGEWVSQHWAGISEILTNTWDQLTTIWKTTWNELIGWLKQTWSDFTSDAKYLWDGITGAVTAVWDTVTGVWQAVWSGIIAAVKLVWETFKAELSIFDAILSYLLPFWDPIKAAFLAAWNAIVGTITTAWGKIQGIFDSATGSNSFLGKLAATFGIVKTAVADVGTEMGKTVPKANDLGDATKTLTAHQKDNTDQITKLGAAHKELQDKFKASKDATAVLWAESQILNSEYQKSIQFVAALKVQEQQLAAQGKTLVDAVVDIKIPLTDATAGVDALGKAAAKTMGQIAAMSDVVGAGETALKNLGITSSATYQKAATDAQAAHDAVVNNPLSTEWDKAQASAALLKTQITALTATEGDHAAELDILKQKLKDTEDGISHMATSTTDAYHNLNLNTVADIQAIMDKDQARWTAAQTLADTNNPAMIKQMHEAELQMLKDYDDYGIALSASQKQRMEDLEKELGKHHDTQKEAWQTFEKDVKKDFDTTFKAMEDLLITGDGSFHDIMKKMWQSLAQDALDLFLAPLKKAIEDFIATTLKSLLGSGGFGGVSDAIAKLGKDIGGLFGGGASAAGGVPSSIPGIPNVPMTPPAAPGAAGAAGSVASAGLSSIVGMVTGIVSSISSIISNFQQAKMETTLNAIEHNTRYTMMYVGERADGGILGVLFKIDEEIAWGSNTKATENLRDLFLDWSGLVTPIFQAMQHQLEGMAPYIADSKDALMEIRDLAADLPKVINAGFNSLNITVTATGVTTAEAARKLGDQIAANLSRQLVPTT
jgi:tape measure domain-containing protein